MPANAALRCQSNIAARSSWAADDGVVGASKNIVPVASRTSGRGREICNRFRALSRRYREKLGEPNEARDQPTALVAGTRGDETRDAGNSR